MGVCWGPWGPWGALAPGSWGALWSNDPRALGPCGALGALGSFMELLGVHWGPWGPRAPWRCDAALKGKLH